MSLAVCNVVHRKYNCSASFNHDKRYEFKPSWRTEQPDQESDF